MANQEIERQIREWRRGQWPIGMILCLGAAIMFYASLEHELQTTWEFIGFFSLVAAGIFNGVLWVIRGEKDEKEMRKRLGEEKP